MAGEIIGGHPGCAWACRAAPASVPVSGPLSAPACAPAAVSAPRWGAAVRFRVLLSAWILLRYRVCCFFPYKITQMSPKGEWNGFRFLSGMLVSHPAAFPCVEGHQHGTQRPRHRVEDEHALDARKEGEDELDPHHTEQAQRDQQHHHGWDAGTRAAHGTGKAVQDAEQEVERTEPPHGQLAVGDHGLVGGEQVQNGVLSGQ